jgi:hypothetical protein
MNLSLRDPAFVARLTGGTVPPPVGPPYPGDLIAHWSAESVSLADGSPVDAVPDGSGNGNGLEQTYTSPDYRPLFRTNQVNGRPAFRFAENGDRQRFFYTSTEFYRTLTEATFFVVARLDQDPGVGSYLGFTCWNHGYADAYPYTDGNGYVTFGSTDRKAVGNPVAGPERLAAACLHRRAGGVDAGARPWVGSHHGQQHRGLARGRHQSHGRLVLLVRRGCPDPAAAHGFRGRVRVQRVDRGDVVL